MKRILSAILAVVMMLSAAPVANIFVNTDTAITAGAASTVYYKVVNTGDDGLRLRKGPSTKYSVVVNMPNGSKVKYLGSKSNGFYKVSYTKNGKTYTGWCSATYLSKVTSSSSSSSSVTSSDISYLEDILSYMPSVYKSSSSYARNKAYQCLFQRANTAYSMFFRHYGWSYSTYYSGSDPKGYFKKGYYECYRKLSASKVDWILKNVYNVTPDHSKVVKSDGYAVAYYSGGYYYQLELMGGDFNGYYIVTSRSQSNGYYIIKGGVYGSDSTSSSKWNSFSAKVKLKTVDGKKVWSIYTYSKN